ncbi:paraquat-inducible protein A [Pseudoduganella namucuonensis]|nr:paraquat-inducible protein A [Pseudoduganella namucuonensis]
MLAGPCLLPTVYRYDLISCHDCGVLHRRRPVGAREKARCVRCRSVLYRGVPPDLDRIAAVTLATLFVFLIAQFFPIVEMEMHGSSISATLFDAIRTLWMEDMRAVAVSVFLFTIVFPVIELGALLYVSLALRAGYRPPGFHRLLRAVRKARQWGMTEVLMMGILIAMIKLTSVATLVFHAGLFAFGALTLMLTVVTSFDPRVLWDIGDRVAGGRLPAPELPAGAPARPPLACHACGLVAADSGRRHQHCARCGTTLHRRYPDSIARTWALLLAAAILYIPANTLPMMYTDALSGDTQDTIISGVIYFWDTDAPVLAVIIFIASIVVPVLKLAALSLLAYTTQRGSRWRPYQRTVLYRMVEFIGRWSMLDIFVITLTVALVRFNSMAVMTPGPGALAFCAVVVLTMLAALEFDPRLIWDHEEEKSGEQHV